MEEAALREQMLEQLAEQDRIDQMSAAARRVKCAEKCMHAAVTLFLQCTECDMTQRTFMVQAPGTHQGRRELPGAEAGAVRGCLGVPSVPYMFIRPFHAEQHQQRHACIHMPCR